MNSLIARFDCASTIHPIKPWEKNLDTIIRCHHSREKWERIVSRHEPETSLPVQCLRSNWTQGKSSDTVNRAEGCSFYETIIERASSPMM